MAESYEDFLKYSTLLHEGDLVDLFDIVKVNADTLSEAARRCGIERKTIYDMMSRGKQVKQKTKERILRAALKSDFEKSMALLLSKAVRESRDIYANYLALIYQSAMRARDGEEFKKAVSKFDSTIDGLLALANIEQEIGSMTIEFANKAAKVGTEYTPRIPTFVDTATLSVTIPALIKDLANNPVVDIMDMAMKWRISPVVVTSVSDTMRSMPVQSIGRPLTSNIEASVGGTIETVPPTLRIPSQSNPEMFENLQSHFAENHTPIPISTIPGSSTEGV